MKIFLNYFLTVCLIDIKEYYYTSLSRLLNQSLLEFWEPFFFLIFVNDISESLLSLITKTRLFNTENFTTKKWQFFR